MTSSLKAQPVTMTARTQGSAYAIIAGSEATRLHTASKEDRMRLASDDANQTLDSLVRPPAWRNPPSQGTYDFVVIGGGTAGLVSAVGAAGLGARVALVERARLGGDCLNTGCVPSKAILRTARAIGELRRANDLGVRVTGIDVDFPAVMRRMRQRRVDLAVNDSAQRLALLGIQVFFGDAAFTSAREIAVGSETLRFTRAAIATGSRPAVPPIDGLSNTPYLTNETVFDLTERPDRLLVIGGGAIGCELSQAFARFGSRVTVFDQVRRVLANDDPDASIVVERALTSDGVQFELGAVITHVSHANGAPVVHFRRSPDGPEEQLAGDHLLVATGRASNIERLDLARAGIHAGPHGVVVDDRLRTSNHRVYAAGDVCSRFQFTHVADASARIVIQNALFFGRRRASALTIPWCTYTDPEVAHVGLSAGDAEKRRPGVQTILVSLSDVDRAVLDDEAQGFVKVHHDSGRLLGCTIVAAHAGEMIGQASNAIARGATLNDFSSTIYTYPTQAEALRKAGDAYRRTRLTPGVRRWFERYFRFTRW
jgi:pyruvate/2-oxoglutarate dehydrogenase complex dihydrolipoamide dehydrogenase (E3) component